MTTKRGGSRRGTEHARGGTIWRTWTRRTVAFEEPESLGALPLVLAMVGVALAQFAYHLAFFTVHVGIYLEFAQAVRSGLWAALLLIVMLGVWWGAVRAGLVRPDVGSVLAVAGTGIAAIAFADLLAWYVWSWMAPEPAVHPVPGTDALRAVGWGAYVSGMGLAAWTLLWESLRRGKVPGGTRPSARLAGALFAGALLVALAVLLARTAPGGPPPSARATARQEAWLHLKDCARSIRRWTEQHGHLPEDAADFLGGRPGPYGDGTHLFDPWSQAVAYRKLDEDSFVLTAVGPDGRPDTEDDVEVADPDPQDPFRSLDCD